MSAMPRSSFHGAVAICLLLFFLLAPITASSLSASGVAKNFNGSCIAAERAALLTFKAGISSDPSRRLRSWRGHDCCRWHGVRCSARTGHVVKLDLHNDFFIDDFYGFEHAVHWLRGKISPSLLALRHLKHLDLSGNDLGGDMPIPEFMGSLKSLTYLDLSQMNFSGPVPPQLGNLTELVYLAMHSSYSYTYSLDVTWLESLHSLEYLDMGSVGISASVGWVHSVNTLSKLRVLYLSNCGINSSTPSLLHRNLTVLEKLHLHGNPFNRPVAPNWFWDVTSLKVLRIFACGLSGPFPDESGNLTMLETLDMASNNIEGMIPSTLKNLCSLQFIRIGYNNIGGDIRDVIERLPNCSWNNLQQLYLMENNLTGTLKPLLKLNLTALTMLSIYNNHLSGSVPEEIGKLKNLTFLYIGNNSFSGVMSEDHFSGLTNLKYIDLSHTYLQIMVHSDWEPPFNLYTASFSFCHLGPKIPNWLRSQKSIWGLDISDTGLIGKVPDWFWATFSNATDLDLSYNQVTGELPLNLEFMSVTELHLQSNNLTGSVPRLPRNIEILDISKNSLNGEFPSNFGAPYLQDIILFSNFIRGIIPESICLCPQLRVLDLSNNLLTGGLPNCGTKELKHWNPYNNSSRVNYISSYNSEIRTLILSNNHLSGEFPLFLKQCYQLKFLDLTQNKFSGNLPAWISEDMPSLVMLRLRSNNFCGHIPDETTSLFSLRILDLADNAFSGVIPQSLVNFRAFSTAVVDLDPRDNLFHEGYESEYMYSTGLYNNSLSLVTKGQVLDYRENVVFVMSIDISSNRLCGQIPEGIGSLHGLKNLNLSSNLLSGNIPNKICNLKQLESLDLSNNQLSSEIPQCLSNLTSLSYLNLSYNNLSGRIPLGNQLDTLKADDPASVYIGNPNLCGHPLQKLCPGDEPTQEDRSWHDYDNTQMDFLLGLTVGFIVGLWTIFCSLLFKKNWIYTCFSLLDKLYGKVWIFSVVTWQQWFRKPGTF